MNGVERSAVSAIEDLAFLRAGLERLAVWPDATLEQRGAWISVWLYGWRHRLPRVPLAAVSAACAIDPELFWKASHAAKGCPFYRCGSGDGRFFEATEALAHGEPR